MKNTLKLLVILTVLALAVWMTAVSASAETPLSTDGTDAETVFNDAIAAAAADDVTITLTGTWTLTDNVTIGSAGSIPTHTISVMGGTIATGGFNLYLYGHFEFSSMTFNGNGTYASNALVFPEGCSGTVLTGMTEPASASRANFIGQNIEVNSGAYYFVGGNINGTTVTVSDPHVVIKGTAKSVYAAAGTYNGGGVSGDGYIELNGSATISSRLMSGGWYYTANSFDSVTMVINGGTVSSNLICTDGVSGGTISTVYNVTVNGGTIASMYALQQGSSGTFTLQNLHVTINGGTITNLYCGPMQSATNTNKLFRAQGTVVYDLNGGTFTNIYGGAKSMIARSESRINTTINVNGSITVGRFVAGSELGFNTDGTYYSRFDGTTTVNFTPTSAQTFTGDFYLGCYTEKNDVIDAGTYYFNSNANITFASRVSFGAAARKASSSASIKLTDSAARTVVIDGSTFNGSVYGNALNHDSSNPSNVAGTISTGAIFWSGTTNITADDATFTAGLAGGSWLYGLALDYSGEITWTLNDCTIGGSSNVFLLGNQLRAGGADVDSTHLGGAGDVVRDTITINANNCTVNAQIYGHKLDAWKIKTETTLNVNFTDTTCTKGTNYFGMGTGGSYCEMAGDTTITIVRGSYPSNSTHYFGSYLSNIDCNHSGTTVVTMTDTTVTQPSGNTSYASLTFGSVLKREGAKHTGDIIVTMNNCSVQKALLLGCYFDHAGASMEHSGDREITINGGTYAGVYGGSCVPKTSTTPVLAGDSVINITGGTFSNVIHGGPDVRVGDVTGNYTLNLTGGTFTRNIIGGPNFSSVPTDGTGTAPGVQLNWTGNSTVNFGGTATAEYSVIAGFYGYGICHGDTKLNITGGTIINKGSYGAYGGCYGLNNLYPDVPTEYDGVLQYGIRHYGNAGIDISGGDLDVLFYGSGIRSNVVGNVTHNISGGDIKYLFYAGSYMTNANWQNSVVGNVTTNITGGTFSNEFYGGNGGTGSARETYKPSDGYNLIKGNCVVNIEGGHFNKGIYVAGSNGCTGDVICRFAGDQFVFDGCVWSCSSGAAQQPTRAGTQILDLSGVTLSTADYAAQFSKEFGIDNGSGSPTWFLGAFTGQGWITVYPALSDIDTTTVTGYTSTYAKGDEITLDGATFAINFKTPIYYNHYDPANGNYRVINSITLTAEKIDELVPTYLDGITFKSGSTTLTDNKVGALTTSVTPVDAFGAEMDALTITNTTKAAILADTDAKFTYLGVSIRPADNALRARAALDVDFRGNTLASEGFIISEYGMLVSKGATELLTVGGNKVTKLVSYDGTTDTYFLEDGKYKFAAAITNIGSSNYDAAIKFRPYCILVDEYGTTVIEYADLSGVTNFKNDTTGNIEVSLRGLAVYVKANDVAFYTKYQDKIDAIIGA